MKIISLDGRIDGSGILLPKANAELSASALNAEFLVCFEKCIPNQITEFDIAVLVFDDGCPIGSSDTINVHVAIERPIRGCIFQTIDFPVVGDRALVDKTFALNATASSGLPVQYISSDETIASVNASVVTMHKTGAVVIKATQPGDADYLPAPPISRLFCVKPSAPQIRLEDDNRTISSNATTGNIWFVDGVQNSQLTGKTITITGPLRNYTARVEANGCRSDESNGILITSLNEQIYDKDISVFPNPAIEVLSIEAPEGKDIRVEVWSMQGKTLIKPSDIQSTHHLNVESISTGVYLVKIHVGGAVLIRKFVKN